MRKLLLLSLLALGLGGVSDATPTLVQIARCPNALAAQGGPGTVYTCPLPQSTLANNFISVNFISDSSGGPTFTISDNASNTYTQDVTNTTANVNVQRIYHLANAAAGITKITVTPSVQVGFINIIVSEWFNVATSSPLDVAHCNSATSTSITAGSMTIGTTNDLVIQHVFQDDTTASGALTVGSQANITWTFGSTDRNDSAAIQWGIFSSTGAFNPTFTQGTSHAFASCAASYKAATSGTAPSATKLINTLNHSQMPASSANPFVLQNPFSGNLFVVAFTGGGDTISSITSSPSCTWSHSGSAATQGNNAAEIWYALGCSGTNNMTVSVTRSGTTHDGTFMLYDINGAGGTWTFDTDGGILTGVQNTIVTSLTTCSSCLTPSASNGVAISDFAQDFCTATASTAPSSSVFDSATDTINHLDGPQPVDQNNGWLHLFYSSSPGTLSATWTESCASTAETNWAGKFASFKFTPSGGVASVSSKRGKIERLDP